MLALAVPTFAAHLVAARAAALAAHLGAAAGVPAQIGRVDADLTARIRLSEVSLGALFAADSLEASVGFESLLSGQLAADELRVAGPRVAVEIDPTGDSDLARLVRRLAKPGPVRPGPARLRRIVVSSGVLAVHVTGLGEIAAEEVELVPDAGGVRVITGKLHLHGEAGGVQADLVLARAAADVTLPHVELGRVLAVAGTGALAVPDSRAGARHSIALREISLGRLVAGGPLQLRAALDEGGVSRPLAAEVGVADPDGTLAIALRGEHVPLRAFAALAPRGLVVDDAHATGAIAIRRTGHRIAIAVDGALEGARLDHALAGGTPIAVEPEVHGTVLIDPDAITADHLAIVLGAGRWTASGVYHRTPPIRAEVDVALETAPCAALVASLPHEIRGPLDGMGLTGTFGGRAHVGLDLGLPAGEGVFLAADFDNRCTVTAEPPGADVATLIGTLEQTFADGTRAKVGRSEPGFAELRTLPPWLVAAFVAAEDGRFYDHHGFDLVQIAKSFEIDLRDRKLARGGSTISQQLVKNSFLAQHRTLDRKLQEAILTWRLEARLSKPQILERYLNIIELGPHVFGVGAAARYWFGVPPQALDVRQAAFLAALTSEPRSMGRRVRHASGLDAESAARVDIILHAMARDGWIDKAQVERARELPLRFAAAAALKAE